MIFYGGRDNVFDLIDVSDSLNPQFINQFQISAESIWGI